MSELRPSAPVTFQPHHEHCDDTCQAKRFQKAFDELRRLGILKRPPHRLTSPYGSGRWTRLVCDECGRVRCSWDSPCKCPAGTPAHIESAS